MKKLILFLVVVLLSAFNISAQNSEVTDIKVDMKPVQGDDVFTIVENMPEFPGGIEGMMKYFRENIKYPAEAKETGVSGKVFINFIVDTAGNITNAKVIRGVNEPINAEALRVVNAMPAWKPGTQKGKAVKVSYNIPINFTLDTTKMDSEKLEKE